MAKTKKGRNTEEIVLKAFSRGATSDEAFEKIKKRVSDSTFKKTRATLVKDGRLINYDKGKKGPGEYKFYPADELNNVMGKNVIEEEETEIQTEIKTKMPVELPAFFVEYSPYELFKRKMESKLSSPKLFDTTWMINHMIILGNEALAIIQQEKTWKSRKAIDRVCKDNIIPLLQYVKVIHRFQKSSSEGEWLPDLPSLLDYITVDEPPQVMIDGRQYDVRGSIGIVLPDTSEGEQEPKYPSLIEWKNYLFDLVSALEMYMSQLIRRYKDRMPKYY